MLNQPKNEQMKKAPSLSQKECVWKALEATIPSSLLQQGPLEDVTLDCATCHLHLFCIRRSDEHTLQRLREVSEVHYLCDKGHKVPYHLL